MEVYTTNDFAYAGNIYHPELDLEQPKGCLSYTSNHVKNSRKINNRSYDINTSNYKKLTTNKDAKVIELYDDLEDYVLKKDRKIIRNYLVKGISFKYRCRIFEVTLNETEMLLCFLKDVKIFDKENKLSIRKGYEKCSLKYKMRVGDANSLNYAKYLIDKEYEQITNPFMINHLNNLTKILTDNVKSIDRSIKKKKIIKGIVLTASRNFLIIEKRSNCLYIRILAVEDENNILSVVGRRTYEPLCRSFKIKEESDIETIMPLIKTSFELTKINPIDVKNKLNELYYKKNSLYYIDNDIITIIASDDISNYKDLIYNGKTLNYSRIKFYNLKNITDSQTKLLLYKYVNIDNALNKDKYSEVQFISYTSLFKNAFENSNLDIHKYIYNSTKVNK